MTKEIIIIITFLSGFIPTFFLTPYFMRFMVGKGYYGNDMNKIDRPKVAEMGGIIIWVFLIIAYILGRILWGTTYKNLLYSVLAIISIGLVGLWDDLGKYKESLRIKHRKKQALKVILLWIAPLPLIIGRIGFATINIPIIGSVDFGIIFWFLILPMIVTGSANLTNLLAGLNGLEIGASFIVCIAVLIVSFLNQLIHSFLLMLALAGTLLAFLYYNKFPARIFPGDIGTLTIGGVIAIAVLQSGFKVILILVMIPYLIEFLISARLHFNCENFGIIQENGKLAPMQPKQSLTHYIMALGEFSESQVVFILWAIMGFFASLGVLYYILVF